MPKSISGLKAEGYDAVAELDRRLKKHYTHQE